VYRPTAHVPAAAPPPAYRPTIQAKLAPPSPMRITPPHPSAGAGAAPNRFMPPQALQLKPMRNTLSAAPASSVLRPVPQPVLQLKPANVSAGSHPTVRVQIGAASLPVQGGPRQTVQLKKDVKVIVDTQVRGSNTILDVQVNSAGLRNHWTKLGDVMGPKPKPVKEFVDRHILPMEFIVAMEAQSYKGKTLSAVIPGLSLTETMTYPDAARRLEDQIAKNIRTANNEVFETSKGVEQCWHFWGHVEENSYRNNYVATKMGELRKAILKGKKGKVNSLREAIVFTWFDTPTYDWQHPWSWKMHHEMAEFFCDKVRNHVSTLPEFSGWTIPTNIMNRTPQRVWQNWSNDDDNTFYTPGLTESRYGPNKGLSAEKIDEMRTKDDDYYFL
jgi:hypothetical protein